MKVIITKRCCAPAEMHLLFIKCYQLPKGTAGMLALIAEVNYRLHSTDIQVTAEAGGGRSNSSWRANSRRVHNCLKDVYCMWVDLKHTARVTPAVKSSSVLESVHMPQ